MLKYYNKKSLKRKFYSFNSLSQSLISSISILFLNISDVLAGPSANANQVKGGAASNILPFVMVVILFYFLMIRPQQKKQQETKSMLDSVKEGDNIVTSGGIVGRVKTVISDNDTIVLSISDGVDILLYKKFIIDVLDSENKESKVENEKTIKEDASS